MGKAIPRTIRRHTHPAARPDAAPPPRASGIDYLGLVASRVAAESARRIAYVEMASPDQTDARDIDTTDTDKEIER